MLRIGLSALVALFVLGCSAHAQDDAHREIDARVKALIDAHMQAQSVAGLSLAVVKDGRLVKAQGYGTANIAGNVPARSETVYRTASAGKQFIASAIMLLVEAGKLSVDDKISRYLRNSPAIWSGITVRHLLSHTSGLVRGVRGYKPSASQNEADLIAKSYGVPLDAKPGEQFGYSNLGYFILAEIITVQTGDHWSKFIKSRIFDPADMTATRLTTQEQEVAQLATGYVRKHGRWEPVTNATALRPSGAFISSVLDLAKWDAALRTDRILSHASRKQMWSPVRLNDGTHWSYGFGWHVRKLGNGRLVDHTGAQDGYRAVFTRYVDADLASGFSVIILTNKSPNKALRQFARDIAAVYLGGDTAKARAGDPLEDMDD